MLLVGLSRASRWLCDGSRVVSLGATLFHSCPILYDYSLIVALLCPFIMAISIRHQLRQPFWLLFPRSGSLASIQHGCSFGEFACFIIFIGCSMYISQIPSNRALGTSPLLQRNGWRGVARFQKTSVKFRPIIPLVSDIFRPSLVEVWRSTTPGGKNRMFEGATPTESHKEDGELSLPRLPKRVPLDELSASEAECQTARGTILTPELSRNDSLSSGIESRESSFSRDSLDSLPAPRGTSSLATESLRDTTVQDSAAALRPLRTISVGSSNIVVANAGSTSSDEEVLLPDKPKSAREERQPLSPHSSLSESVEQPKRKKKKGPKPRTVKSDPTVQQKSKPDTRKFSRLC